MPKDKDWQKFWTRYNDQLEQTHEDAARRKAYAAAMKVSVEARSTFTDNGDWVLIGDPKKAYCWPWLTHASSGF